MSPEWFDQWLPAFLTTVLAEAPIFALFLGGRLGIGPALAVGVALQAVTHPLFWLAWERWADYFFAHYSASVWAFETVIYLVEAGLVWVALPRRRPWERVPNLVLALVASTVANSTSLVIGMLNEH